MLIEEIEDGEDSGNSRASIGVEIDRIDKPKKRGKCCSSYQITDEFLLNTNSGKVWKFDKASNCFIGILKKPSKSGYSIMEKEATLLKQNVNKGIKRKLKKVPTGDKAKLEMELKKKFIDPIQNHLDLMKS